MGREELLPVGRRPCFHLGRVLRDGVVLVVLVDDLHTVDVGKLIKCADLVHHQLSFSTQMITPEPSRSELTELT